MNLILCSAILVCDQKKYVHQPKNVPTGFVVCGRRHHNCITTLQLINKDWKSYTYVQGFITTNDTFVNRMEAAQIALDGNQIKKPKDVLFSEDLW